MLTMWGAKRRLCDGISRRDFLRVGALGGLSLANLLRAEATSEPSPLAGEGRVRGKKSVIYVVLGGGPSHIDMYDLKPEAPEEYRGPFKPIATSLPGVQIGEHMPLQAGMMDQLTLLRGIRSVENDHFLSEVYTGLPRSAGSRPAFGCVVSRLGQPNGSLLPPYVSLEKPGDGFDYQRPHYAGASHRPFCPFGEAVENLKPAKGMTNDLLHDRKGLLQAFDILRRDIDQQGEFEGMDRFGAQALEMITSSKVRDAFDLSKEPDRVLRQYGQGQGKYTHQTAKHLIYPWDSRKFILARRLVEAGARVVTVQSNDWDHHGGASSDIFYSLSLMLPALDRSLYALMTDLRERGLEKDVLVVVLGEFGRTPKIEKEGPGRGHHAEAGCATFFGGGLKMGQVIGETDSRAERSKSGNLHFQNILATIYHVLGIDPRAQLTDFAGRPQYLLDNPEPIAELV
jgi:hypothetical protein